MPKKKQNIKRKTYKKKYYKKKFTKKKGGANYQGNFVPVGTFFHLKNNKTTKKKSEKINNNVSKSLLQVHGKEKKYSDFGGLTELDFREKVDEGESIIPFCKGKVIYENYNSKQPKDVKDYGYSIMLNHVRDERDGFDRSCKGKKSCGWPYDYWKKGSKDNKPHLRGMEVTDLSPYLYVDLDKRVLCVPKEKIKKTKKERWQPDWKKKKTYAKVAQDIVTDTGKKINYAFTKLKNPKTWTETPFKTGDNTSNSKPGKNSNSSNSSNNSNNSNKTKTKSEERKEIKEKIKDQCEEYYKGKNAETGCDKKCNEKSKIGFCANDITYEDGVITVKSEKCLENLEEHIDFINNISKKKNNSVEKYNSCVRNRQCKNKMKCVQVPKECNLNEYRKICL